MENSKLIVILKTLSKTEMKDFGKFVSNIYTEKSSSQILYNYLKTIHPLFPSKKVDKAYIEKKLFKEAKDPERRLFDTKFKLLKTLKEFIIKKQLEKNSINQDLLFLEALKTRRLDNLFFNEIEEVEKKWEKNQIPGIERLYEKYKLKAMYSLHPKSSVLDKRAITPTDLMGAFDKHYIATKLYWTLCSLITQNFTNSQQDKDKYFIEEVLKYASLPIFEAVPQIKLFRNLATMIRTKNVDSYQETKQAFFNQFSLYSKNEQHDLINFFICCCYNIGTIQAYQELFEIKKFAVEKKIILEDGFISSGEFINIVNLGCKVNEIEWTTNFISVYRQYLETHEKENTILFCEATMAITKKQFDIALPKLVQIKFDNVFWGAQARCMRLQCYYELDGYEESFIDLINSLKVFLRRKEMVAEPMRDIVAQFARYVEKIEKIRREMPYKQIGKKKIEALHQNIVEEQSIMFKDWLVSKVEELSIK